MSNRVGKEHQEREHTTAQVGFMKVIFGVWLDATHIVRSGILIT